MVSELTVAIALGIPAIAYLIKTYISWKIEKGKQLLERETQRERLHLERETEKEKLLLEREAERERLISERETLLASLLKEELSSRREELVLMMKDESLLMRTRVCAYEEYCFLRFNGPSKSEFQKVLETDEALSVREEALSFLNKEKENLIFKYKSIIPNIDI
jgi:hypothetical protein